MADPERFDGSNPKLYAAFERGIRAKFRIDGTWYPTEAIRADYIFDRLTGKAKTQAEAWLTAAEKNNPTQITSEALLAALSRTYKNTHAEQQALDKLSRLQQGQQAVAGFLAYFDTVLTEAGGHLWTDDVKINYLKRTLKSEIRQGMVGSVIPRTYSEFCTFVREIDVQLWEARQATKPTVAFASRAVPQTPSAHPDAMDWTRSIASLSPEDQQQVIAAFKNLKLSNERARTTTPRTRITPEEKERRRQQGLCFRCGEKGHPASNCPLGQKPWAPVPIVAEINTNESEKEEPLT